VLSGEKEKRKEIGERKGREGKGKGDGWMGWVDGVGDREVMGWDRIRMGLTWDLHGRESAGEKRQVNEWSE
jgi:hypothetical protein